MEQGAGDSDGAGDFADIASNGPVFFSAVKAIGPPAVAGAALGRGALSELATSSIGDLRRGRISDVRTVGVLKVGVASNAPCDGPIAQQLSGSLTVRALATAYVKDGLGRGVHAGDCQWISAKGDEIDGGSVDFRNFVTRDGRAAKGHGLSSKA